MCMVSGCNVYIQAGGTHEDRTVRAAGVIVDIMDVCGVSPGGSAGRRLGIEDGTKLEKRVASGSLTAH